MAKRKKKRKTRRTVLYIAIGMVIAYTVVNCLFGMINAHYQTVFYFDSTQTSEWFEFWKWVVVTGAIITCTKTAKGNTNSDNDESEGTV